MASEKVYPSWRYHKEKEPRIVKHEKEDRSLGKGWADTPAAFDEPEDQKLPAKESEETDQP